MKDIAVPTVFSSNPVIVNMNATYNKMENSEHMESQFETDTAWKSSVLRVFFKNESFARKYKVKIEKFLEELLDEGEEFDVYQPPHTNHKQEYEDNQQTFHVDKVNETFDDRRDSAKVPVYSSAFEDTLHCNKEESSQKNEEEKPSMMTCFNCLGNHHMKQCPVEIDRTRINENKKEILASTIRYHTDDQNNGFIPGKFSDNLRDALGLQKNQLPQLIYHMRVIGYPPGWMNEAVFEQSGLSMYDSNGKAVSNEQMSESQNTGTFYDATKFIEFPGFNTPIPQGFIDEWKNLNMPPLQPHQQLCEALKSPNIINSSNLYKRKQNIEDVDSKKLKNVEQPCSPLSKVNLSENCTISPEHCGNGFNFKTPDKQKSNRHSMSISMSPGTPVLEQGNPYQKLPDANRFAEGIAEHLPFENLPDAVGTFEKMRGVISDVQKKLNDIKKS